MKRTFILNLVSIFFLSTSTWAAPAAAIDQNQLRDTLAELNTYTVKEVEVFLNRSIFFPGKTLTYSPSGNPLPGPGGIFIRFLKGNLAPATLGDYYMDKKNLPTFLNLEHHHQMQIANYNPKLYLCLVNLTQQLRRTRQAQDQHQRPQDTASSQMEASLIEEQVEIPND